MATYLLRNGILSVDGVAVLQAATGLAIFVLEEIIKANTNQQYQTQSLIYQPDSKAWSDEHAKLVLFILTNDPQIELIKKVISNGNPGEIESISPLLLTDNGIPYITDLGNSIIMES